MSKITAWETEDGTFGIEDPWTAADIGNGILSIYSPGDLLELLYDYHGDDIAWEEWDFSDPDQVGDFFTDKLDWNTCAWHIPEDVYGDDDPEASWGIAYENGRIRPNKSFDEVAPKGYVRVVFVEG